MKPVWKEHTFAVCAYKESPYLEECICSLLNQKVESHICVCTSTPNKYIEEIAGKYQLPLYINRGDSGIGEDWNFALSCAATRYVTLAHQDDIYKERYSWEVGRSIQKTKYPALLVFTNYNELRQGTEVSKNSILRIKRLLLTPLKCSRFQKSVRVRRRILGFGNAICCPSVTYDLKRVGLPVFIPGMRSNLDWETWERLSKKDGSFIYLKEPLMCHRIHQDSETSAIIRDDGRSREDYEVLRRFWPEKIAGVIGKLYKKGEKSNHVSGK